MPEGFLFCALLLAGALYWWESQGAAQRAVAVGRRACQERNLQFLDESVMRSRLWLRRDERGVPRFWRRFEFEFTTDGQQRFGGMVIMIGDRVTNVQLDPYPISDSDSD